MAYLTVIPTQRAVSRPLWRALRNAGEALSVRDLHIASGAHPNAIQLRLNRWERAGYVTRCTGHPTRFVLEESAPATPPTVNKWGESGPMATNQDRLWRAMRILKRFDIPQLQLAADTTRRSAETYVNSLRRAGYVSIVRIGARGHGEHSTYQLVKSTGRQTPAVLSRMSGGKLTRRLFDPNSGVEIDISPGTVKVRPSQARVNHDR